MSLTAKEWISYLLVIIFTFILFWLIIPSTHYQPKGIALPMTQEMSDQIKNSGWHGIGTPKQWINLEYHITKNTPAERAAIKAKGLQLAKQAGANHFQLLMPVIDSTSTEDNNMLRILLARGIGTK